LLGIPAAGREKLEWAPWPAGDLDYPAIHSDQGLLRWVRVLQVDEGSAVLHLAVARASLYRVVLAGAAGPPLSILLAGFGSVVGVQGCDCKEILMGGTVEEAQEEVGRCDRLGRARLQKHVEDRRTLVGASCGRAMDS